MQNFELLFDLIPPHPGLSIALIEDSHYRCADSFGTFCQSIDASLHVKKIAAQNSDFDFDQKQYNTQGLQYDFLFVCADLEDIADISHILRRIYRAIKNGAQIYLVTPKISEHDFYTLLEESNYVAINTIDLNENIDIITAKKMHGWRKV